MLGMLALSQQKEQQQPQHVEAEDDVVDNLYIVPQLPGLRGSPKVWCIVYRKRQAINVFVMNFTLVVDIYCIL